MGNIAIGRCAYNYGRRKQDKWQRQFRVLRRCRRGRVKEACRRGDAETMREEKIMVKESGYSCGEQATNAPLG